jgi:GNAT superfamily N-acetyltransferase
LTVNLVSYANLIDLPLLAEYAAECSIPEIGPAHPQPQIYAAMEKNGLMQCFGAPWEGAFAGFGSVLTPVLPHYGLKVATVESLFVSQDKRRCGLGRELMRMIEQYSREQSSVGILYSAPAGGQLERVLDRSKHYRRTNTVFYRSFQ